MSKTSTLALSASVTGDGLAPGTYIPPQSPIVNPNAPEGIPSTVALSSGSNTIAVPPGALHALVVAPMTSTNIKNAKTTSGDAGIAFTNQAFYIPVAGISSLYISATAGETISIAWL